MQNKDFLKCGKWKLIGDQNCVQRFCHSEEINSYDPTPATNLWLSSGKRERKPTPKPHGPRTGKCRASPLDSDEDTGDEDTGDEGSGDENTNEKETGDEESTEIDKVTNSKTGAETDESNGTDEETDSDF